MYDTRSIIIATGSRPIVPEEWLAFGDRILTTDTLFEQRDLGPRMAIIGLGPLGAEIAQALARLGVEVAAFSSRKEIAGLSDPAVNDALLGLLKSEFVLNVGAEVTLREVPGASRSPMAAPRSWWTRSSQPWDGARTWSTSGWKRWAWNWTRTACRRWTGARCRSAICRCSWPEMRTTSGPCCTRRRTTGTSPG